MSLLSRCLHNPQSVYALNDELVRVIGAENPHVTPLLVAQMRLWNTTMWCCPRMPPCMAVLVLFWLAESHEGVQTMFMRAESNAQWRDQLPALFAFSGTLISDIASRSITPRSTVRRALQFYAALLYVVLMRRIDLIRSTPTARSEKVAKPTKDELMDAWLAKQRQKGRAVDELDAAVQAAPEEDASSSDSDSSSSDDDVE